MASADPGIVSALSEDTTKGAVGLKDDGLLEEEERPVAPDQFDERYETSKWEIWSYYAYYIGNNGLTLFNFGPTAAQNLVYQHAEAIGGADNTMVRFAGSNRTINSVILLCNGISFAIQCVIFLVLGSFADFGTFRPNILIVLSLIAWGIGFGWMGVHTAEDWQTGLGLYMVGLIAYQLCLTYWTAAFPGLARNTKVMRDKAREFETGDISRDEYDHIDSMKRNELSNTAFYVQSVGELFILAVIVGIGFGLRVNASTENNNYGLSVLIAFASGVWLLLAIPWFVLEKRRPGQDPGMNIVLAGFWQLRRAVAEIWQLRQSLFYLIGYVESAFCNIRTCSLRRTTGLNLALCTDEARSTCMIETAYFLLGDSLNTTVTVIGTLQNEIVAYNFLELTYLLIVGIAAQAVGIFAFWNIQKRYGLSTKTMFNAVAIGIILLDGWGMIGIWTQSFGFHHKWEVWVYQVFYGLFVCPWYSYSQTMISEVTPRGKEFLFFSLFSIIGKTSSFIGPFISSAIIDDTGNNSSPFYFLFALSLASFLFLLFFVDVKKSRIEQAEFLERERLAKEKLKGPDSGSTL